MAQVTMTYDKGWETNLKPDVDNMIVNINPTKTPFSSGIPPLQPTTSPTALSKM